MGFFTKREGYKKPDLNAPRFRRDKLSVLSLDLYKRFMKSKYKVDVDYETYKKIVRNFNSKIREKVISHRDGVEFPEQLGFLFIGTCPKSKQDLIDVLNSAKLDKKIKHKNWESNQYVCKIFYSNFSSKYKFANRELWYFVGNRKFKRSVSAAFPDNWNKYIKVSPISKVSEFFKKQGVKAIKVQKHDRTRGGIDFSNTQPE